MKPQKNIQRKLEKGILVLFVLNLVIAIVQVTYSNKGSDTIKNKVAIYNELSGHAIEKDSVLDP